MKSFLSAFVSIVRLMFSGKLIEEFRAIETDQLEFSFDSLKR